MMTGSCLCGGVRYEFDGPLRVFVRCHCVQCRKASGAEFATNASVQSADFRLTAGEELLRTFEWSPGQARVFCGRCGSPLMKRNTARPEEIRLRLGCVDGDLEGRPVAHVFVSEKPNWSDIHDDLPQFETVPDRPPGR
jgi:hypothetical protein